MRTLTLGPRLIGDGAPPLIIAEIGNTHNGSVDLAKRLIEVAADCGAGAVKLQKKHPASLLTKRVYNQPYQDPDLSYGPTYGLHKERLELPESAWGELKAHAEARGVLFFATPFDLPSADFLQALGVPCFKVASAHLRSTLLVERLASFGRPLLLSTGGATLAEIQAAVEPIRQVPHGLLHCTMIYPTEDRDLYLGMIPQLRDLFPETPIGFSCHGRGVAMAWAAVVLGAAMVEVHFTLDRYAKGRDHKLSLEPDGLRNLCSYARRWPDANHRDKPVLDDERLAMYKMGHSLVATRDLPRGHCVTAADVAFKIPGGGYPPSRWADLLGRRLDRPVAEDETFAA